MWNCCFTGRRVALSKTTCCGLTPPWTMPGNRRLGEYDLDHVGSQFVVSVKATAQRPERRIQVCVRADGPKRVLQLIDMSVSIGTLFLKQQSWCYRHAGGLIQQ